MPRVSLAKAGKDNPRLPAIGSENDMWKAISLRRPLPQRPVVEAQPPDPRPTIDNPFADLMAKLDRIPYQRRRRTALGGG